MHLQKTKYNYKFMEIKLKVGNRYSLEEIYNNGFTNVNVRSARSSFKKDSTYLSFDVPGKRKPHLYKLLSIAIIT